MSTEVTSHNAITDVEGILVGHDSNFEAATGCTVVLCPDGATGGVDVRGGSPGTRETDLLSPTCRVETIQAILLSGGSAFGLDAAGGVMRFLEERGYGLDTGAARVPLVPTAVLYDLAIGKSEVRPTAEWGYRACLAARSGQVQEGSVGAATGATVGKLLGLAQATKGGLGTASMRAGRTVVGALVAVNALGDVIDPANGAIIAGARATCGGFANSIALLIQGTTPPTSLTNTTIGVVATNASLTKAEATKVAQMAHDGLAMAIRPVHTMADGDVVFALATGRLDECADVSTIGALAAQTVATAVVRAVRAARGLCGVPSASELCWNG